MANIVNAYDNVESAGDVLLLLVTAKVLDDAVNINLNTTASIDVTVSVPWSGSSAGISPSFQVGEPVLGVATSWFYSTRSGVLTIVHTISHMALSELAAANVSLSSNVTGSLVIETSDMVNGTLWPSLPRGSEIVAQQVIDTGLAQSASPASTKNSVAQAP